MRQLILTAILGLALGWTFPGYAQRTVTLTPSVTQGAGEIVTQLTWDTNPRLTTGTPCTASGHPDWTGPKAGSGGPVSIRIATSGTLPLSLVCNFPGDSIVTFSWTPAATNTDGSTYTDRNLTRIRYTFNATLPTDPLPPCDTGGVSCQSMDDSGATRPTMRTITGITQTGTMRGVVSHLNSALVESAGSNVVTKVFTGNIPVTQSVSITVNPRPAAPTGATAQ